MACSIDLTLGNLVLLGAFVFALKKLIAFYQKWRVEKMLEKWTNSPKDKIILHTIWRCKTLPSLSPFGLKLETYLRLAKIPYELDTTNPFGAKGKIPWITHNGTHISDSQLIIQYLNKKLGINLNAGRPAEQLAAARACRVMLEEHFGWGIVQYRWKENLGAISQLMRVSGMTKLTMPLVGRQIQKRMEANGIGLHTPTEIYQMTADDLHTVSSILGSKKFLGGDEPCEDDCAVFGIISQALWGTPGSSFERLVHGELSNLKDYCERMKEKCWPDWENCIDSS